MVNDSGIPDTDKAYIAGLFDGEGSIHFKRGPEKKKKHKGKGYRISNSLLWSTSKPNVHIIFINFCST